MPSAELPEARGTSAKTDIHESFKGESLMNSLTSNPVNLSLVQAKEGIFTLGVCVAGKFDFTNLHAAMQH